MGKKTVFYQGITKTEQQLKVEQLFQWILTKYPHLTLVIKWNQPMFMDHGTFILGFSFAKDHIAIAPEKHTMDLFRDELMDNDYQPTSMMFRIKWNQDVNFDLLAKILDYNIKSKQNDDSFWRK
ncbi:MAG: iron chaperone [Bacilli bacterium]